MKKIYSLLLAVYFCAYALAQSGNNCNSAIQVTSSATCTPTSYTTTDSVMYFSFTATSPDIQISVVSSIARCVAGGHPHQLTLFGGTCAALQTIEDEFLPDIAGCQELNIDASNLTTGATYYIRVNRGDIVDSNCIAQRVPASICFASQPLTFSLCVRSLNIIIPKDFGLEPAALSHAYHTNKGQILDVNGNPRFDIQSYTNNSSPAVYHTDTAVSFVFASIDTLASTIDTLHRVDMTLVGANTGSRIFKTEKVNGYLNYFLAHVPTGATNIKGYSRTVNTEVYPNIDMQFYSNTMGVKFYFIVRPGGNADNIVLNFAGANSVTVNSSKGLDIQTSLGTISFEAGHAYQVNPAGNIVPMPWQAEFIQLSPTSVKFDIRNYPANMPLFIQVDRGHNFNPTPLHGGDNHEWATYFGGNGYDEGTGVITDTDGNAYFVGFTNSSNFPTFQGLFMLPQGNFDAYIAKFTHPNYSANPQQGDQRVWVTYYGGTNDDSAFAVTAVGNGTTGKVYVTGKTKSSDFPTNKPVSEYYQNSLSGTSDAFLVVLDNDKGGATGANQYQWATYFGGSGDETGLAMAKDGSGNIYIGGSTSTGSYSSSTCTAPTGGNFPKCNTASAFDNNGSYGGGTTDGFLAKFSNTGQILWSTFYGGADEDAVNTLAVDASNNLYIGGKTASASGFPLLDPTGSSDYYQGTIGGTTAGQFDGFLSKFDNTGTQIWSTYYGGNGDDVINGIDVETISPFDIFITGSTSSATPPCSTCFCKAPGTGEFPLCNPGGTAYFQGANAGGYDGFLAKFSNTTLALTWSTYFGGSDPDEATAITTDVETITTSGLPETIISITGQTFSFDMPLHSPSFNSDLNNTSANTYIYPTYGGPYYTPWVGTGTEAYIAMFTGTAKPLWGVCFGEPYGNWSGTGNERSNCIVSTKSISDKHLYTTGWTDNTGLSITCKLAFNCDTWSPGNTSVSAPSAFNVRFAYYAVTLANPGVPENSFLDANSIVFPNPTIQSVTIKTVLEEKEEISIIVFGITGQKLYEEKFGKVIGEFKKQIDFSSYDAGIYFLQIQAGEKSAGKKIIKQ